MAEVTGENTSERTHAKRAANESRGLAVLVTVLVVLLVIGWGLYFPFVERMAKDWSDVATGIALFLAACAVVAVVEAARRRIQLGTTLALFAAAFAYIILVFSTLYSTRSKASSADFAGHIFTPLEALYFALGTITTAGTGDFKATEGLGLVILCAQLVIDFVFATFAVAVVVAGPNGACVTNLTCASRRAAELPEHFSSP